MNSVLSLSNDTGKKPACEAFNVPRASFYRYLDRRNQPQEDNRERPTPPLALSPIEKQSVLDALYSERFQDKTPYEAYATLLDDGAYYCSISTMYRILNAEHGNVEDRRRQVKRPYYSKPELLATMPNQVWSWDITKLKGPVKWTYFYLYVIMDIFSRYVVGWMVAHQESTALAKRLIEQSCIKQNIEPEQLTLHADRGPSMKSKGVAQLLADLGVTKTHSRPYVSNDNPYSESQFKTLKYCPDFPGRFGSIQDSRAFCQRFFPWYNEEHYHAGIALMTPENVHYGMAQQIYEDRVEVLKSAFDLNPKRFKGNVPKPPVLPKAAWINKPETDSVLYD